MRVPSIIGGLLAAALLLALLGFARLLVRESPVPDLTIREIEISSPPPPPPPPAPPAEPPSITPPPPPPAVTEVSEISNPDQIPIPKALVPPDLTLPVDPFFSELEVAPLPEPLELPLPRAPSIPSRPPATEKPAAPPAPALVEKAAYQVSELDAKPRVLRYGSAPFPAALARRGIERGTVVLEVELSARGSVRVRSIVSATHPELVAPARRIASSARFTAPTRNGRPVSAVMHLPIVLER